MKRLALVVLLALCGLAAPRQALARDVAASAPRVPVVRVPGGLVQITGKNLEVGQSTFPKRGPADPFVEVRKDGTVRLYGTIVSVPRNGHHTFLEFDSLKTFLNGGRYTTQKLHLSPRLEGKEQAWDFLSHTWPDGQEVLYAGVVTPTGNRKHARMWEDNWTRRIYAFSKGPDGQWVMHPRALFNPVDKNTQQTMIGHTYGHDFTTVERDTPNGKVKETWLFHEEISGWVDTPVGRRLKTEIFARKMLDPFTASDEKVQILGVGDPPRYGKRSFGAYAGEYVIEGPRPFSTKIGNETYHFISFSAADFAGDGYDIHFAYRRGDAIGPYTPLTQKNADGTEGPLTQYAAKLKAKYGLSWVGRAHVLEKPDGSHVAVFHAVSKAQHPDADYSGKNPGDLSTYHRNVYAVPVTFAATPDGTPQITLVDDPREATAAESAGAER